MNEIDKYNPKVLHVSYSKYPPMGVIEQLKSEIYAVKQLGIPWESILIGAGECDQPFYIRQKPNLPGPLRWLLVYLWIINNKSNFDIILMRWIKSDFIGWIFVPFIKNIVFVNHTKEIEECSGVRPFWYGWLLSRAEKTFGRLKLKHASAIAAVTNEIAIYQMKRIGVNKPAVIIPNGINTDIQEILDDRRTDQLSAIYVASKFEAWHGLDLLLASYKENPQCHLNIHLVGKINKSDLDLVNAINDTGGNIFIHGVLAKDEISHIISECHLGLGSFGLFRNKLTEACTLKTREYLACGLPVYASHQDSGLPDNFQFFVRGEPDVLRICDAAYDFRQFTRREVAESARSYIDKANIISNTYDQLKAIHSLGGDHDGEDRPFFSPN